MSFRHSVHCSIILAAAVFGSAAGSLPAQAEVSFAGKEITMIIPSRAGGGSDAVGRLLGEYLAKYLPGNPSFIARNMSGGGGITGLNYFATSVEPDGLTITAASSGQSDPLRFRRKISKYDAANFRYIGGVSRGSTVLVIKKDAASRITDPKAEPVIMGALDGTRSGMVMAVWGREFLGWNLKWVIGYPGTSEVMLALQRGEIDMTSTANLFHIKELTDAGTHEPFAQSGTLDDGVLKARAEFPDAMLFPPKVRPLLKNDIQRAAFDYWEGLNSLDKWLALPGGTSDEVLKAYRTAFRTAAKDEEFIARGKKSISQEFTAIMPEDQEKLSQQVARTPDESLKYLDDMRVKQGLPSLRKKKK